MNKQYARTTLTTLISRYLASRSDNVPYFINNDSQEPNLDARHVTLNFMFGAGSLEVGQSRYGIHKEKNLVLQVRYFELLKSGTGWLDEISHGVECAVENVAAKENVLVVQSAATENLGARGKFYVFQTVITATYITFVSRNTISV